VNVRDADTDFSGCRIQEGSLNLVDTMRSLKADNQQLIQVQKQTTQLNFVWLLRSLSEIQKQLQGSNKAIGSKGSSKRDSYRMSHQSKRSSSSESEDS
jgi:hypothetical protein